MRRSRTNLAAQWLPYWLNPWVITTLVICVSLSLFLILSDDTFAREFRQGKASSQYIVTVYGYIWLMFSLGLLPPLLFVEYPARPVTVAQERRLLDASLQTLKMLGYAAFALALFGNAVYFGTSDISLSALKSALRGDEGAIYALKASFEKTPGVTSLMNLAPWWFAYAFFVLVVLRRRLSMIEVCISGLLLSLSVLRGFAVNERRVIFEIFVPAVIVCLFLRRQWPAWIRFGLRWAPVAGPAALVIVFVSTEYFRTWVNFWGQGHTDLPYLQWALTRLAGYYATALNNGGQLLANGFSSGGDITFSGLTRMPLLGDLLGFAAERQENRINYALTLKRLTNPEFNNQGGAVAPLIDFGWTTGGLIVFSAGFAVSLSYLLARRRALFAILLYSQFFFALLEMTRVWHFMSPISVINLLFLSSFWVVTNILEHRFASTAAERRPA